MIGWIKRKIARVRDFNDEINDPVRSEERRIRQANEMIAQLDGMLAKQIRNRDEAQARLDRLR